MADDKQEVLGKWTMRFQKWTWEYVFSSGGKVTWRDPYNGMNGVGQWSVSPKLINIAWNGSQTKESWTRPIKPIDQSGWYSATYGAGNFKAQKVVVSEPAKPPAGINFAKPSFASTDGAAFTSEGRQWRQELDHGGRALIGITGVTTWNEIELTFNNPRIASIERESPVSEHVSDIRVTFKVVGLEPGDAELTAFSNGTPVASMQIHVRQQAAAQATYVDNFMQGFYDPDFRHSGGNWSKYIIVQYHDDVVLPIHMDQITDQLVDFDTKASYIKQGAMGEAGRRFPLKMNASTTPNLHGLKRQAIEKMSLDLIEIIKISKEAIIFVLNVGEAARSMMGNALKQMARRNAPAPVRKVVEQGGGAVSQEMKFIQQLRAANPNLSSLTNEELLAIREYTGEGWAAINSSLRGGAPSATAKNVVSGLNKLPGYAGRVIPEASR